jgi:hypothetical protein
VLPHVAIPVAPLVAIAPSVPESVRTEVPITPQLVVQQVVSETAMAPEPLTKSKAEPFPASIEKAMSVPAAEASSTVAPVRVEHTTYETFLKEIVERVSTSEPISPQPTQLKGSRPVAAAAPQIHQKAAGDSTVAAIEPRKDSMVEAAPHPLKPRPVAEKRDINVRIGTLELKLSEASPSEPSIPIPSGGFEDFEEVRMYRT